MPSLVEGFGYVYLEALSHGCFCVGTDNTGLPDITNSNSSLIIPAADPFHLTKALIKLESIYFSDGFNRDLIKSQVEALSWSQFRQSIVNSSLQLLSMP